MKRAFQFLSWGILLLFVAICAHYTILNAAWLIGDDAIVVRHTGVGEPFIPSDTIIPSIGRFFPLSYIMYDVLLLFYDGWISPYVHYSYQAICFGVGMMIFMFLIIRVQAKNDSVWKYVVALCSTIFLGARMYNGVINCYSTIWFDMFTQPIIILFFILFYQTKNKIYGCISLMVVIWCMYCSEIGFALPLVLGICGLIFRYKTADFQEKSYYFLIVANALIFLLIYLVFIRTKTVNSYDPAHGSGVTFFHNIVYILRSQKFLWLALILLCVRIWDVLYRKSDITIYDILLLAAVGHCCACFILKLNWVLYYHRAIYFALPAVVYYFNYYLKCKATATLMLAFAAFYCVKMPKIIKTNQHDRIATKEFVSYAADKVNKGCTLYWYAPDLGCSNSYDNELRTWTEESFQTLVGWNLHDMDYRLSHITEYNRISGFYLLPIHNENMQQGANAIIESDNLSVPEIYINGIKLYKIE